jgi:hypothetical protein
MTTAAQPKLTPQNASATAPLTFTRRKRIPGRNARTYREWRDQSGRYVIVWRKQAHGVSLPPQFFALTALPGLTLDESRVTLDGRHPKPLRTFDAAERACQRHADEARAEK